MEWKTLQDWLLKFVLTPGGAGAILYFILGNVPGIKDWFEKLGPKAKELVVMLAAFGIPLVGTGLAVSLGYLALTEDVVFMALQVGFLAWAGNQVVRVVKKMAS